MSHQNKEQRPPWIIRTYAGFGNAEDTNGRFHENLQKGQTGLSIAFDLPTQNGYDPDAAMANGEVGGCGVSIAHLGDMETMFRGIDLGSVNTSMTINSTAPFLLALYLALAEKQGVSWNKLRGTVQNDLLKEFVARGTNVFSPEVSLKFSTDIIEFTAEHVPQWNPINVCGYHYMESGARPYEEIGYAFGNALIILDTINKQLSKPAFETVVRRISFFINSGIELVPELCKMRAYAQLWPQLCREEYGIEHVGFRAGCQVRSLSLTAAQPENNIVRIALEALPVILSASSRVNALQLPGFREALALPDTMEQSLSIRTQQILMHETKITEYPDIFEGNTVIANITEKTIASAKAIALFLRTMGYENIIQHINTELTKAMLERQNRIDNGEEIIVGVNSYLEPVGLSEQLAPAPPTAQKAEFEQKRNSDLAQWRNKRDLATWCAAKEQLQTALTKRLNIMPASIEFVKAGGTIGEWSAAIESITSGRYNVPLDLGAIAGKGSNVSKGLRIVLGKAGLDGHNNAVKLLAIACRDAGMEVIFAGTKLSPATLMKSAAEEDADVLGVSCLSGAHIRIASEILSLKAKLGMSSLKIVIGGTIPENDRLALMNMGVDLAVSTNGGSIHNIIEQIIAVARI